MTPAAIQVLVVDDTAPNLVALEAVLAPLDITIVRAVSGAHALALVRAHTFAVVILDVMMPGMDGFEAARRMREIDSRRLIPIIFLTGFDFPAPQVRRAYASGAVDFVVKPFDPDILRSKVSIFAELFRKSRDLVAQGERLLAAQAAAQASAITEARLGWEAAAMRARATSEREEAQARERELQRIDRLKDEFLATLAHELRNPLASLLSVAELLERQPVEDPERVRLHRLIHRQVAHLCALVEDSLEISRFTQGKIAVRPRDIDLRDAVERAIELSRAAIDRHGIALVVSLPPAPLRLRGDPVRLAQVVSNLLDNAAKFTPQGGRVWVTLDATPDQAIIRVRDSGRGIEPAALTRIFNPFVQSEAGDVSRGGLGIGLALVKRLVELHGGTVHATSAGSGQGAELVVTLPVEAAAAAPDAAPAPQAAPTATGCLRVLVVDDNPEIRHTVQLFLQLEGHAVETADCGRAALEQIRDADPDVVLLDIGLPDVDGYAVAEQVRATRRDATRDAPRDGRRPRLIALTGVAGPRERARALRAGFDAHVSKPVDGRTLLRAVRGE